MDFLGRGKQGLKVKREGREKKIFFEKEEKKLGGWYKIFNVRSIITTFCLSDNFPLRVISLKRGN